MTKKIWSYAPFAVATLFLALAPRAMFADDILNVSVNTSSLLGQSGSEVVFVFTDGSGTGDANNTLILSDFTLGGGSAGAVDTVNSTGGYALAGNLASTISLTDSSFLNLFGQFLDPGSMLDFTLDTTTNVDAGGTPDQFSMYLYDPIGNPISSTSDPSGLESLLTIDLDSPTPTTNNYDTALVSATPVVATPEPASLTLLAIGLLLLLAFGIIQRRKMNRPRVALPA